MKFSVEKTPLYEAVSAASKACSQKSALNILDGILMSLEDNTLTITGYDLEIAIKISISVEGHENGKVVTDPRLFSEMVKKMPGEIIDFTLSDNKTIKITSGKSKFNIACKPGEEFPNIIEVKKGSSFNISEKILKELFTRIGFAVSRINAELESVKIETDGDLLYAVATDGNRLAAKYYNISEVLDSQDLQESDNKIDLLIPEKAVSSLVKSLSDDAENKINVSVDTNQICISKENYILISRLIEGKFVNYKRIIDTVFPRVFTVNVKELSLSMERCLLLMSDKLKIPALCSFKDGVMNISCKTAYGAIDEEITVEIKEGDFEDYSIHFNPRFMLEALQKTNCEEIKISLETNIRPFKLTPKDDNGDFVFIIVPIRSNN
ncbi:MAG: DNA polymerase III subunit beta [Oscillospiraceae bacterium]|nr:DNA polymerase III subunit beta [Oscillospiraceae bacterium]